MSGQHAGLAYNVLILICQIYEGSEQFRMVMAGEVTLIADREVMRATFFESVERQRMKNRLLNQHLKGD